MKFKNTFKGEIIRDGKVVHTDIASNLITTEGANSMLDIMFDSATQITSWYLGLISGASPTVAVGDTLASHAGWTEFSSYTGNRQAYVTEDPSSGSIVNSVTVATFPITAGGTVGGAFLSNAASGTSGKLFSASAFASPYTVINGDSYRLSYTIQLIAP